MNTPIRCNLSVDFVVAHLRRLRLRLLHGAWAFKNAVVTAVFMETGGLLWIVESSSLKSRRWIIELFTSPGHRTYIRSFVQYKILLPVASSFRARQACVRGEAVVMLIARWFSTPVDGRILYSNNFFYVRALQPKHICMRWFMISDV